MSDSIDSGGYAFPQAPVVDPSGRVNTVGAYISDESGMTLRDYFAAKALEGLMSSHIVDDPDGAELLAEDCYKVADAMIAARKKKA